MRVARRLVTGLALGGVALSAAVASTPHVSAERPARPYAELKIYSSHDVRSTWSGVGLSTLDSDICIASSTGRFRLEVTAAEKGAGPKNLRFALRFRDATGLVQTGHGSGPLTIFEGSSLDQRSCDHGPNAQIVVESTPEQLLEQQSGAYTDRLILSVTPL